MQIQVTYFLKQNKEIYLYIDNLTNFNYKAW